MDEIKIANRIKAMGIPHFLGTFPLDRIPLLKNTFPYCYIFNHDRHDQTGSHWSAVIVHSAKKAEYFDSLGQPPPSEVYRKYSVKFNTIPLQHFLADTCGHHCIYYLFLRLVLKFSSVSVIKYLSTFKNLDTYVKNFVMTF